MPISAESLRPGMRVRLTRRVDDSAAGPGATGVVIPEGSTATITEVAPGDLDYILAVVTFDHPVEDLMQWGNGLHIYKPEIGEGLAGLGDFEAIA